MIASLDKQRRYLTGKQRNQGSKFEKEGFIGAILGPGLRWGQWP